MVKSKGFLGFKNALAHFLCISLTHNIMFLSVDEAKYSNVEEKFVIHRGRCNNKVYYRLSHDVVT